MNFANIVEKIQDVEYLLPIKEDLEMKRLQKKHFYDYEWQQNPNAVYIGRPSKWGNPFKVSKYGLKKCLELYEKDLEAKLAVEPTFLDPLIGKDLVCFCPLDKPCHADVIIKKLLERKNK